MARKPINISTAAPGDIDSTTSLKKMIIAKVTSDGKIDESSKTLGKLLLNPESLNESKTSNWVPNAIPGQSEPILQWTSGASRTVSFDALVTADQGDTPYLKKTDTDPLAFVAEKAVNAIGGIAASFLGVNISPLANFFSKPGQANEVLSIENQLQYYRSLAYPVYQNGRLKQSPPLVVLYAGKAFGDQFSIPGDTVSSVDDLWVLAEYSIKISKQLPNLTPMEATVSFKFIQYAVSSIGSDKYATSGTSNQNPVGKSLTQTIAGWF